MVEDSSWCFSYRYSVTCSVVSHDRQYHYWSIGAFVGREEEAKEAIKRMNGGDYNGNRIKVAEAQEKPNTGGNGGGGFKRNNRTEKSY